MKVARPVPGRDWNMTNATKDELTLRRQWRQLGRSTPPKLAMSDRRRGTRRPTSSRLSLHRVSKLWWRAGLSGRREARDLLEFGPLEIGVFFGPAKNSA